MAEGRAVGNSSPRVCSQQSGLARRMWSIMTDTRDIGGVRLAHLPMEFIMGWNYSRWSEMAKIGTT